MDRFKDWSQRLDDYCKDILLVLFSMLARFLKVLAACQKNLNGPAKFYRAQPQRKSIDISKTIIAVDFEGILIDHSRFSRKDMNRLNIGPLTKTLWEKLQFWRDVGYFFRKRTTCDRFVWQLSRLPNTVLLAYSKQDKQVVDELIEQLRIGHYFPIHNRRYGSDCGVSNGTLVKHPAYVDCATARVIILTTDAKGESDGSDESLKYFLQVPNNATSEILLKYCQLLNQVLSANQQREDLHEEMQNKVIRWRHRNKI